MAKLKLSSPWSIFYKEVSAMFEYDPDVSVVFDEDEMNLKLYVNNADKADALMQLIPHERDFGNVSMQIEIVPADNVVHSSSANLFERAFFRNEALAFVREIKGIAGFPNITYVVFVKRVVQYYTDNLSDIYGITSTLYQNIAQDIFINIDGVFYCTDTDTNIERIRYEGRSKCWP